MVRRGEIYWASLAEGAGRRPVCVLTRNAAIEVLTSVTCAPITRTIRGIRSEVLVDSSDGLPEVSVISCDNITTIPQACLDDKPVGELSAFKQALLDRALSYALDIRYVNSAE